MNSAAIQDQRKFITPFLLISLLIHATPLLIYHIEKAPTRIPPPLKISLKKEKQQIVTPPNLPEAEPLKSTKLLSDRNTRTPKEQIRRGDDPRAGVPKSPQVGGEQKPQTIQKKVQKTIPKKQLKSLTLDSSELLARYQSQKKDKDVVSETEKTKPLSSFQAFARSPGQGAVFHGRAGIQDHLPTLPDGDITLLNAKAERFAVFVRRVATRVFSKLRSNGWESLSPRNIQSISDFSTITAVLSPEGKILRVELLDQSGSVRFDEVVYDAVQFGSSDPHPPLEAAAEDGNIHFIFRAKSWVKIVPGGRDRPARQQRWLLLGTGLR